MLPLVDWLRSTVDSHPQLHSERIVIVNAHSAVFPRNPNLQLEEFGVATFHESDVTTCVSRSGKDMPDIILTK